MYRVKRGIYMCTGSKAGVLPLVLLAAVLGSSFPAAAGSGFEKIEYRLPLGVIIVNANSILQAKSPSTYELASKFLMHVTAYSSSVDETDSTPHVTASGTKTRDGVVASNAFPIGTQVKIPDLFGDKILVVEDRMHWRFTDRIDVWMPSKWQALHFGKKQAQVEIIEL
ncbi:MAG: 3D domain-containing protein [Candidatus Sungbacteria bacterium]|uniref:3D domain-containing protein n=1 Tax=Candidatus Sungiibacteriota bacterium TaxID=2750080 RepID=A0A933DRY4_9BACT|nr:3D domain-containing protein [Candidatus Sungbacteria bacterium]